MNNCCECNSFVQNLHPIFNYCDTCWDAREDKKLTQRFNETKINKQTSPAIQMLKNIKKKLNE